MPLPGLHEISSMNNPICKGVRVRIPVYSNECSPSLPVNGRWWRQVDQDATVSDPRPTSMLLYPNYINWSVEGGGPERFVSQLYCPNLKQGQAFRSRLCVSAVLPATSKQTESANGILSFGSIVRSKCPLVQSINTAETSNSTVRSG